MRRPPLASVSLLACLLWPGAALAQWEEGSRGHTAEQLQDPATDLMNITFSNLLDLGVGDRDESEMFFTIEPQLPLRVVDGWNMIVWSLVLLESRAPLEEGTDRLNGVGDTVVRLLLSPSGQRPFRWGLGPVALIPTATREGLAANVFGLGAVGAISYRTGPWTLGLLVQHVSSVQEERGIPRLDVGLIRPNLAWTLPTGVSVGLNSQSLVAWRAAKGERWVVPIEMTLGQIAEVGQQVLNFQVGVRRYFERPPEAAEWGVQFTATFVFPVRPKDPEDM